MKLLVTGGAGFIGSNFIINHLTHFKDDEIVNYDNLTYAGNLDNLSEFKNDTRLTFVHGDITDGKLVKKALDGVDVVVHFAAESHVDKSINDPSIFVKTNVVGTHVLLEESLKAHVKRFHHISTDEVFGSLELGTEEKFNEDTKYVPNSPYSASKAGSDHLVHAYYTTYGLPVTISNCSNNFGPYQYPEKLIPLAVTNILEGKKIPVYGDGKNVRDWLFVLDHCEAIELILKNGKVGETYCVGGMTDDISNIEIVKKILMIMGESEDKIEFVTDRKGHDRRYAVNWSKIENELGWKPKHDFDTWLSYTINWYKSHTSWWKKIKK